MGLFKPDAPEPPNPLVTAAASTSTNVNTAVANAYLNNVNQQTPEGSLTYSATGSYQWTDPTTGQSYTIPTFTSKQELTPAGQNIKNITDQTKTNLATMGQEQSARIGGMLNTPFTPNSSAPAGGNAQNIASIPKAATSYAQAPQIQSGLGNYGKQQTAFDNTGLANASNITNTYAGADNFSKDRDKMQAALMARMNPQLDVQRQQLQQQLADQGIRYGSQAYNNAMMPFNQQVNDARYGAIANAGQEQQRMNQMAAQAAAFQNAAQQQAYQEAQGRGQFANEAQQQTYNQALGSGAFYNQAQNQQFQQNAAAGSFYNSGLAQQLAQQQGIFNAAQAQRNQGLQEAYMQRNQPLNEISALMSGSQLQQPSWINAPQSQIPTTDMAGLINQNFNQQLGIYQQQNQQYNQLVGGALGLGAGALKLSDVREKEDIKLMGSVFSGRGRDDTPQMASVLGDEMPKGSLPIYEYSYKDDPSSVRHIGPMAQDVEKVDPKAVKDIKGKKYIDQRRLMGGILRAS